MENGFFSKKVTRREFCKLCVKGGIGIAVLPFAVDALRNPVNAAESKEGLGFIVSREALYYKKIDKNTVQCLLCPRSCVLKDGMRGFCRVREPRGGKQYTLVYGNPTAVHVDPIEKKPLFHFLPGTSVFSIATAGCNYRCKNCQNWQISQSGPEDTYNQSLPPEAVVDKTLQYKCPTIAYTYTEPAIFYEYMLDTAKAAKALGIRNVLHSNGSLNAAPAEELSLYLDGANIDLKGFTQDFYSKVPEGDLDTVLNTLKILRKNKVHLEITNLVIPTLNDDMKTIKEMCRWVVGELGCDTPLHFSRFHPTFKMKNLSPTSIKTLEEARDVARTAGLNYVYIGNIPYHEAENTYCPKDGKVVIKRLGYQIIENHLSNGKCGFCGTEIPGVWDTTTPLHNGPVSLQRRGSAYLG
ncbi:MAG: AmmeMemoRadiSam system radical SAM enzyme [Candidatus Omnitrophica bacterium]|nr:AmmeMemoRadiSam system radical SAM enzyme [Candidatus Omnitrophota bacterium]